MTTDLKQQILTAVSSDLTAIEQALAENLNPYFDLVSQVAGHILFAGGKRLRPLLMVLCARLCDYSGRHAARFSTIFEYLHAATLLHDDVVDGADMRRGKTAAHKQWDAPKVVLTGDPYQIDNPYIDSTNNGLVHVANRFRNEPIAGHITLSKGERSDLAERAANLL